MAETVSDRTRRQAEGLRALRGELGLSRPEIAGRLGFQTTQGYDLYERAKSVLRLDQIPEWAQAFGVSEARFLGKLGFDVLDPHAAPFDVRAYLAASGVVPGDRIDVLESDLADKDEADQVAVCDAEIAGWRRLHERGERSHRNDATDDQKRTRKRAAG